MVKKDQKWEWMERQERAFMKLKKKFTKEPVLAVSDLDKKMRMEVDTLDYATGGVLFMECEDRKQRPVVLQTQDIRVNQEKEPCISVNTRELDRELCTR